MTLKHKNKFYFIGVLLLGFLIMESSYLVYTKIYKSNDTIKGVQEIKTYDISTFFKLGAINYGLIEDGNNVIISNQELILNKKIYVSEIVDNNSMRYIAGFGALKSDPQQGVAVVMTLKKEGDNTITIITNTFLTPSKHGSITAINANGFSIGISTEDKKYGVFNIYSGFVNFPK